MAARSGEPKLLFPGLASFYESVSDLWYPMIRVGIGGIGGGRVMPAGEDRHGGQGQEAEQGGETFHGNHLLCLSCSLRTPLGCSMFNRVDGSGELRLKSSS